MRASTHRALVSVIGSGVLVAALVPPAEAAEVTTTAAASVTIVVSPDGNDDNAGTAEAPLRTLPAAQQAVRELDAIPDGGVSVLLRGGTYQLSDTLALDARDSGRDGHPVTWAAWPGETPVIDGGRRLDGWTVHDPDAGIWAAPAGGLMARQLYVNGTRATRARTGTFTGTTTTDNTGHVTTDASPLGWQRPQGVELVYHRIWTQPRNLVASVSQSEDDRVRVTMAQPGWGYNRRKGGTSTSTPPAWIENDYTFLDEPGEWYVDPDADTVYYIPRDGEDMATADVVLPAVERLTTVHGTADEPVHDLVFDGLTFAHSTWLQPSGELGGHPDIQANLVRLPEAGMDNKVAPMLVTPGAVHLEYAHRVTVTDAVFTRLGNAGIDIAKGSRDVSVTRSRIEDISGSGVQIGEVDLSDGSYTYDTTSPYNTDNYNPDDERSIIRGVDVSENLVTRVGLDYASAVGVFVGYTQDVTIAHNDLFDLPYSAISLGWGWAQPQILAGSIARENAIVGNSIRHAMTTLKDGGAIYTLGGQPGTVIGRNVIDDSVLALYLDEGSSHIDVAQNVSVGSATLALQADFTGRLYPTGAFSNTVRETYWQGGSGPAADGVVARENGDNVLSGNVRVQMGEAWPAAAEQIVREAGIPAGPEIAVLAEDFDETPVGSLPAGWTNAGGAGTATVVDDPDGAGRSLRVDHPVTGSSSFLTQLPFAAQTGQLVLRLRARAEQTNAHGYGPWLRDHADVHGPMVAFLDDSTIGVYRTNSWHSVGPYEAGRWYDLELRIDVAANLYSVAVDGVSLVTEVPFRGTVADLALLQFGAFAGDVGVFHFDDIELSRLDTGAL